MKHKEIKATPDSSQEEYVGIFVWTVRKHVYYLKVFTKMGTKHVFWKSVANIGLTQFNKVSIKPI